MEEMHSKLKKFSDKNVPKSLNMDNEMLFSSKQRIVRREMFEFLTGKPHLGINTIEFD